MYKRKLVARLAERLSEPRKFMYKKQEKSRGNDSFDYRLSITPSMRLIVFSIPRFFQNCL